MKVGVSLPFNNIQLQHAMHVVIACLFLIQVSSVFSHIKAPQISRWRDQRNLESILVRGGDQEELSLDEKVYNAMKKLGLDPPNNVPSGECKDGVCPMPGDKSNVVSEPINAKAKVDPYELANKIAKKMNVHSSLVWAALVATSKGTGDDDRIYNEQAAIDMVRQELDMINQVSEDSDEVKRLISEGYDSFLVRRALAFAEMNIDDARAILVADKLDEDEEETESEAYRHAADEEQNAEKFKTVTVEGNFDPTKLGPGVEDVPVPAPQVGNKARPTKKSDVVFEATGGTVQELVLESPVPVLLDVYADWCGPCKVLGPALEDMAVKAGGAFRLVKVNSDNERAVSSALEVTALPTVFGIRDGKILNMFQGMPRSEEAIKNFMMGLLVPGEERNFNPAVSDAQKRKFEELTSKLIKLAGAACFPFSARERLQDIVSNKLDELSQESNDSLDAEKAAVILRSLLSNIIRDPFEVKFRTVNLENKVIMEKIAKYPSCIAILKSTGFVPNADGKTMTAGKNKKIINVAPLIVSRDCIDSWIDKKRYEFAAAARKRRDEEERKRLQLNPENTPIDKQTNSLDEEDKVESNQCILKIRIDGKKKLEELILDADSKLKSVLKHLPRKLEEGEEARITCVSKKLIVNSNDKSAMKKTLRELGLHPAASLVVKFESSSTENPPASEASSLAQRAATKKKKKKGSHTMQSVGIYSTEDNAKGELIDGGGGVLYEHDVSDDEEKAVENQEQNDDNSGSVDETNDVEEEAE